jgi:hypothetical protein
LTGGNGHRKEWPASWQTEVSGLSFLWRLTFHQCLQTDSGAHLAAVLGYPTVKLLERGADYLPPPGAEVIYQCFI